MAGLHKARVLVVDDDPGLIGDYRQILAPAERADVGDVDLYGFLERDLFGTAVRHPQFPDVDLATFRRGEDAVDAVRDACEAEQPFLIAYIDSDLGPGLDGFEAAERIRAVDGRIQIVLLSGHSPLHPIEMAERVPPASRLSYVKKPFHPFEIQQVLLASLQRQRAERRDAAPPTAMRAGANGVGPNWTVVRPLLDHVPAGIVVFDQHHGLQVANAYMRRMYPELGDLLAPGSDYEAVHRQAAQLDAATTSSAASDGRPWRLRASPRALVAQSTTDRGETICVYCDAKELVRREATYWQSRHAAGLVQALTTLCENVEQWRSAGAEPGGSPWPAAERIRAVARQQRLVPRAVDPSDLLGRVVRRLRRQVPAGIGFEAVVDAGLWPARMDPDELIRALGELVTNACEAMPDGGRIVLTAANVRLDADFVALRPDLSPGEYVRLSMRDTGAGLPPHLGNRAPLPFQSTGKSNGHLGLGLMIVRAYATGCGGYLDMDGGEGTGSTVHLYFPKGATDEPVGSMERAPREGAYATDKVARSRRRKATTAGRRRARKSE